MNNKYDRFFESVKELALKTHLSYPEDIKGLSESGIRQLEKEFKVRFSESLCSYYSFMGERINIICTDGEMDLTAKSLKYNNTYIQDCNFYEWLKSPEDYYEDCLEKYSDFISISDLMTITINTLPDFVNINTEQVLVIRDYRHRDIVWAIDCSEENPIIHGFKPYREWSNEYTQDCEKNGYKEWHNVKYKLSSHSIIGDFRHLLFLALRFKIMGYDMSNDSRYMQVTIEDISWAKCYSEYVTKNSKRDFFDIEVGGKHYLQARYSFYKQADTQAVETGIVMTIDEFEWAFIEYLRSFRIDI
jgi:hypothetical protein